MSDQCINVLWKLLFLFKLLCINIVIIIVERNLNPKAACLKRREEEKAEDGAKLGPAPHHMLSNAHFPAIPVSIDF